MRRKPVTNVNVERVTRGAREGTHDLVAVEEPLQILLEHGEGHGRRETALAVTMRTPGHDVELVRGFLFGEGVIGQTDDLLDLRHCTRAETPHNVVRAKLRPGAVVPEGLLERTLPVTSACGVCGERTVEALHKAGCRPLQTVPDWVTAEAIRAAVASLEHAQTFFRNTGGTHGAALFRCDGTLQVHREDVGRHNALDKTIGAWLDSSIDADDAFVVVSSRASFELVQKTVRASFPMLIAVGAASSLAVDTARRFGLTLVGFARDDRFNVYSNGDRIAVERDETEFLEVGAE